MKNLPKNSDGSPVKIELRKDGEVAAVLKVEVIRTDLCGDCDSDAFADVIAQILADAFTLPTECVN